MDMQLHYVIKTINCLNYSSPVNIYLEYIINIKVSIMFTL